MKKGIMHFIVMFAWGLFLQMLYTNAIVVEAKRPNVTMTEGGEITWKTIDTKASSSTTWSTKGFTVRKDKCLPGGNPRVKPYGEFMIKSEWKKAKPIGDGEVEVTFKIPKDVVTKQLDNAGVTAECLAKTVNEVYLNGIFQVHYESGRLSGYKKTLQSIKTVVVY